MAPGAEPRDTASCEAEEEQHPPVLVCIQHTTGSQQFRHSSARSIFLLPPGPLALHAPLQTAFSGMQLSCTPLNHPSLPGFSGDSFPCSACLTWGTLRHEWALAHPYPSCSGPSRRHLRLQRRGGTVTGCSSPAGINRSGVSAAQAAI